jgi:two-component system response regulator RegA
LELRFRATTVFGTPMPYTNSPAPSISLDNLSSDKSLLLVEDDQVLRERLARALSARGFAVVVAEGVIAGMTIAAALRPNFVVIDLKLCDGTGLDVIEYLSQQIPECRSIVLTGYGNIATAVAAVRYGAHDFLSKPVDADDVTSTLLAKQGEKPLIPDNPMSVTRLRWEHIQRVYTQCENNISETARRLKMHRRTLQRILRKYAPR